MLVHIAIRTMRAQREHKEEKMRANLECGELNLSHRHSYLSLKKTLPYVVFMRLMDGLIDGLATSDR